MAGLVRAVDGALLRGIAPPMSGARAAHQATIIDGMGPAIGDVLARYAGLM